jgi:hypothetical protein
MIKKGYFVLLVFAFFLFACSNTKNGEKPLARVLDKYLYPKDVANLIKPGTTAKDSSQMIQNYIDSWTRKELMLNEANSNIEIDNYTLEKQLLDYKESILLYQYENELIKQKLDTTATYGQLLDYYNRHKDNFELRNDIVKLQYIKIKNTEPALPKIVNEYNNPNKQLSPGLLNSLCKDFASQYSLNDSLWFITDELKKILPSTIQQKFVDAKGSWIEKDSMFTYLVNINDFKPQGVMAPMSFVKETIYKIIINQRKLYMIKKLKEDLYKAALQNGDFETY